MRQPFNLSHLARLLRQQRRKLKLSLNQLSHATGISRRTLARIESGHWGPIHPERSPEPAEGRSRRANRTAVKLLKALLPPATFEATLSRATARDPNDPYSLLPDLFPAFLFHQPPKEFAEEWRREFAPDYADAFQQLINLSLVHSNLGRRLHVWRLQHDLTLIETADLLGLSKSQLHRLERGERSASPRARFRILRLLTLPLPDAWAGQGFSPDNTPPKKRGGRAGLPAVALAKAGNQSKLAWLSFAKTLLSVPPPRPLNFDDDPDGLHRLRFLWLSGNLSTRDLAAELGISQPHLIRLLRGDRRPSRSLREQIALLVSH